MKTRVFNFLCIVFGMQISSIHVAFPSGTEYEAPRIRVFQFNHNHEKFKELLNKLSQNESSQGKIDPKLLKANRKLLESYLQSIQSVALSEFREFSDQEKTAFLINSYNAFTLSSLLENNSQNLENLKASDKIEIFGDSMTVEDFERKFLKKRISDPKALFALFCFQSWCPPMHTNTMTADTLDSQVDELTKNFLSDKQKNRFDENAKILYLSPFFKKYKSEFSRRNQSPEIFVAKHLMSKPRQIMQVRYGVIKVVFMTPPSLKQNQ